MKYVWKSPLTRYQNIYILKQLMVLGGIKMPGIRKSADLRNNYREISAFCHECREPGFITKNGRGDLAVMSSETHENLTGECELYQAIQVGLDQIKNGEIIHEKEMMKNLNNYVGK